MENGSVSIVDALFNSLGIFTYLVILVISGIGTSMVSDVLKYAMYKKLLQKYKKVTLRWTAILGVSFFVCLTITLMFTKYIGSPLEIIVFTLFNTAFSVVSYRLFGAKLYKNAVRNTVDKVMKGLTRDEIEVTYDNEQYIDENNFRRK